MILFPPIKWAQREDCVLVTIPLTDARPLDTTRPAVVVSEGVSLDVRCVAQDKQYQANLPLFASVVTEQSSCAIRPRQIEIRLHKSEAGVSWPRLTQSKNSRIEVDWARWKDEDDGKEDEIDDFGLGDILRSGIGHPNIGDFGTSQATDTAAVAHAPQAQDEDDDDDMPPLE